MQETESIDEYILQHIDPGRLPEIALSELTHIKAPSSSSGFRAFTGTDAEDVCRNDSASSDIGNRNV